MPKLAAGLLMYREGGHGPEVLLVHPGGTFFKDRDDGVWSLPKGLADDGEVGAQLLEVAKRKFEEETGVTPIGHFACLGHIRRRSDGKTVEVWTFAGDCDTATVTSNKIIIEWPPKTGKKLEIPEVDRAAFFTLDSSRPHPRNGKTTRRPVTHATKPKCPKPYYVVKPPSHCA